MSLSFSIWNGILDEDKYGRMSLVINNATFPGYSSLLRASSMSFLVTKGARRKLDKEEIFLNNLRVIRIHKPETVSGIILNSLLMIDREISFDQIVDRFNFGLLHAFLQEFEHLRLICGSIC